MDGDPTLLFALCRAIEDSADNGFQTLDRDSLLAIHAALLALKFEIEQVLTFKTKDDPLN